MVNGMQKKAKHLLSPLVRVVGRTVAKKSSTGGLYFSTEGLDIVKINKTPLIDSV